MRDRCLDRGTARAVPCRRGSEARVSSARQRRCDERNTLAPRAAWQAEQQGFRSMGAPD